MQGNSTSRLATVVKAVMVFLFVIGIAQYIIVRSQKASVDAQV